MQNVNLLLLIRAVQNVKHRVYIAYYRADIQFTDIHVAELQCIVEHTCKKHTTSEFTDIHVAELHS